MSLNAVMIWESDSVPTCSVQAGQVSCEKLCA